MIKYLKRPESIVMHELTTSGIEQFITVIRNLRDNIENQEKVLKIKPFKIDSEFQSILRQLPKIDSGYKKKYRDSPSIDLTLVHPTRFELSRYLFKKLNNFITQNKLEDSPNFWSWLALVYFEDLTAKLTNISTEGNYIPEMGGYKFSKKNAKLYQHSIREGFLMYRQYQDESKIYFSKAGIGFMGDFWESTRGFGALRRNETLHKFILKTYSDPKGSGFARRGATAQKGKSWSIRRLAPAYSMLSVNFAAPLLTCEDLENLLGEDFIPD